MIPDDVQHVAECRNRYVLSHSQQCLKFNSIMLKSGSAISSRIISQWLCVDKWFGVTLPVPYNVIICGLIFSESVSSPHRKSAPQSIPGTAPPSERNISKDQGFSEEDQSFPEIDRRFSDVNEIFSAGASPLPPPPSFDRPPRTTKGQ